MLEKQEAEEKAQALEKQQEAEKKARKKEKKERKKEKRKKREEAKEEEETRKKKKRKLPEGGTEQAKKKQKVDQPKQEEEDGPEQGHVFWLPFKNKDSEKISHFKGVVENALVGAPGYWKITFESDGTEHLLKFDTNFDAPKQAGRWIILIGM